ncbi:nicotinamide-nucleotide amidase [Proteiniborus ethanoligenes]|uniref:Putative competence-damage inducible protein n=1 Tax=Proteiniborus ethanoligenes TaxID=415015 RepID=A0A1H3N9W4_9FIRM|nr:competence/damage-inducible protein A [Proteiniborus ethanoligenes]TAH62983.1 MAG: competence/damage-inducible protein A [Gottschalkiaceae bacterium]SDY84999.1 nicotinamide-nucleotide amidase [Proteiniborus ethanoligenes]
MKAEIISVGTELLLGNILNTNAKFLSEKLAEMGIDVYYQTTVGDNENRILETTINALKRADILIFSGGLGPTEDDCTKEAVCRAINKKMYLDEKILKSINDFFIDRIMPESNKKQAYVPEGSRILNNDFGTAPGFYIEEDKKILVLLPGPPVELIPMFNNYAIPMLKLQSNLIIKSRIIRTIGVGESLLEEKIADLIHEQTNPTLATYAGRGQVDIRLTAKASSIEAANELLNTMQIELDKRIKEYIYSYNNETIEEVIFKMLNERKLKIGFCESCTAGLITSRIASIPGASRVLERSYITYSNLSKIEEANVSQETLNNYGAVSEETAVEMAKGLLNNSPIDISVSVTGIAGPSGETKDKTVGLAYICLATKERHIVIKNNFNGSRETNRQRFANSAFNLIRKYLLELI